MKHLLANLAQIKDLDIPHTPATADKITSLLQIVFMVAGGMSIIFIVLGGMKYVLSQGDPQQTAKAKNTILYAIIGLLFALLAFVIVTVVIKTIQ